MLPGIAAKAALLVAVGASGVAAVHAGTAPSGLSTALAHVPTWTHAHVVLEGRLGAYGSASP